MARVLHDIEKRIVGELRRSAESTPDELGRRTGLSADQIRRGIEWLRLKNLAAVEEEVYTMVSLGKNGIAALDGGLPERRLLDLVRYGAQTIPELQKRLGDDLGPAMGVARRNGWVSAGGDGISMLEYPDTIPGEAVIITIAEQRIPTAGILDQESYLSLKKRPDYIVETTVKSRRVRLTGAAAGLDLGSSQSDSSPASGGAGGGGRIDVEADVPQVFAARRHPLKETIEEIREAFVTLGFSEISGGLSQPCFWNFDALFTPQDHPAREMQDTFYLDGAGAARPGTQRQIRGVSAAHRAGWHYEWDLREAKRTVLRTHTTCVTIRHLAENRPEEARIFSLGRVFRNEKTSYKHLVEFNQVEGVIAGSGTTLRDLMGIQKEFYRRIGITKVRFWPTFFPYTEPSLQTMVYNERMGRWVELFGMGIFRPEVTVPLGIGKRPVLAWGGGIERIAMLRYGLDDVRELYANDLGWLRNAPRCP